MASQDWFEKDFYATLGVPTDAGADDIKKAYRKLARIHHPDANSGDASSEKKFKEISEDAEFQKIMKDLGQPVNYMGAEEYKPWFRKAYDQYGQLLKTLGIEVK
jgi:hypothetical protein